MYNTSIGEPQRTFDCILEGYVAEFRCSGYKDDTIKQYITSAIMGYERKLRLIKAGELRLHRRGKHIRVKQDWKS